MGQQQLLILVLGAIVVGLAIMVAILMFQDQASAQNRDAVTNDLSHFASMAQAYYRKPRTLGGGGHAFTGMRMNNLTTGNLMPRNPNGTYSLSPDPVGGSPPYVTLTGVGTEVGNDGLTPVRVVAYVYADSVRVMNALGN